MGDSELEALVTPKIKRALQGAMDSVGQKEFASLVGSDSSELERVLDSDNEYVPITTISLACQINKTHGDTDPERSSVTECLKGTIVRIPQRKPGLGEDRVVQHPLPADQVKETRRVSPMYDQKSMRILNFSANTISFLILGYLLGGLGLSPLLGSQQCLGISFAPTALTPCAGSILGLIIGSVVGLGYTYYYFVKKM